MLLTSRSLLFNPARLAVRTLTTANRPQPQQDRLDGNGNGNEQVPKERPKAEAQTAGDESKKPGFVKGLFLGNFDTDVLTYPEVLDKERHETLHGLLEPIERFFDEKVDSKKIDAEGKIPADTLKGLKELGLFGVQIPTEYGGLGLNATEYSRLNEITALDGGIAVTLAAHQAIGLKGLLMYGTEEQKQKYLPSLASGETIAAFCLTEPGTGSDAAAVQTRAMLSPDGKQWILNGTKLWISNAGIADFFTVFARTGEKGQSSKNLTAFIVERGFGGVTHGKSEDKLGIRGSNTGELSFDNTPIPLGNILGKEGDGFKIAVNILNSGRFSMGSSGAGVLKKVMGSITEYAINRKAFGKPISDFPLIKEKLAKMAVQCYVMESMAYLTSGMIDSELYQDCAVEAAIVKVYSSEACWNATSEAMQVMGGIGYMKDLPYERLMRDSRIMAIFEGTNEILRLFIALMGIQAAAGELRTLVQKMRNPFKYPAFGIEKGIQRMRDNMDRPILRHKLQQYVHPTLQQQAELLEYCVLRLQYMVELTLERHGAKIHEAQLDLKRLAEVVIDCYGMTAVLSRASRAYCIGLRNAGMEINLALAFVGEAHDRVKKNVVELSGETIVIDELHMAIADHIISNKGWTMAHALDRNFW